MSLRPIMESDMAIKFLDIHTLVVTLNMNVSTEMDIQAEECKFALPFMGVAAQLALETRQPDLLLALITK
ncbi:hypothetical protein BGZ74_003427 [Mortierella antarctica]|nr:hypothetical protein BGZ74_003427 [Mortierella antarctica]